MNFFKLLFSSFLLLLALDVSARIDISNLNETENQAKDSIEAPADAKSSLVQAFSYISSAKAATSKTAQDELFANAEKELNRAIKLFPDYAEALMNRGVLFMTIQKLNKAEIDLNRARKLDPKNPNINYNLVCLYSITNRVDLAIDLLDKTLKLGFDDYDSLRSDPDLTELRKSKEFQTVLEKNKVFLK